MMTRVRMLAALTVTALGASMAESAAQGAASPRTADDVVLSAKTPLGEASITLPADSAVTNFVEDGASFLLRQGPFAASVPRGQIIFATNISTPGNPPMEPAAVVAELPAATPSPAPNNNPSGPDPVWTWKNLPAEWKTHWPLAVMALLGAYSLFATVALLRARGRRASDAPQPRPALPAVVTGDGNSIACPLCGKDIAVSKLQSGRNNCPVCRGAFVAERP